MKIKRILSSLLLVAALSPVPAYAGTEYIIYQKTIGHVNSAFTAYQTKSIGGANGQLGLAEIVSLRQEW